MRDLRNLRLRWRLRRNLYSKPLVISVPDHSVSPLTLKILSPYKEIRVNNSTPNTGADLPFTVHIHRLASINFIPLLRSLSISFHDKPRLFLTIRGSLLCRSWDRRIRRHDNIPPDNQWSDKLVPPR